MTDADLDAAAKQVGAAVGHSLVPDHPDCPCYAWCAGCRAEHAARAELERAVAEERSELLKLGEAMIHLEPPSLANFLSAIRARGQR